MKKDIFFKQIDSVIQMNHIFRDKVEHMDETLIKNQKKFVADEIDETFLDGLKEKNKVEFIDGIADVFVTGVFLEYLYCNSKEEFKNEINKQLKEAEENPIKEKFDVIEYLYHIGKTEEKGKLIFYIASILNFINEITKDDYLKVKLNDKNGETIAFHEKYNNSIEFALFEVNESNMSKFPNEDEKTSEQIIEDLEHIKKKVKHSNVGYIVKNGKITYLDLNINKFQKPKTFKEPDLSIYNQFESLNIMFD